VEGQAYDGRDAHLRRSMQLMQLFVQQLEALAKLKGQHGQQRVRVEHVHVQNGGRAVVGVMNGPSPKPASSGPTKQVTSGSDE